MKKKIILASTSPRRHELARQMGLEFEIVPGDFEEDMSLDLDPRTLAMALAYGKAESVAKRFNEGIVLGIDTFVSFLGRKIGKPKSAADAEKLLKSFSGKNVQVYSGVALIDSASGREIRDCEITNVKFRDLADEEIVKYVRTGEPLDKAGAFAIQGLAGIFIEKVDGCYSNIVGFPITNIYANLKKLGVDVFEFEAWNRR